MMRNVPDAKKIQAILELICALDGCILKVVEEDGLLVVYANVASGEVVDDGIQGEDYEDIADDYDDEEFDGSEDLEEDYADYADCYHTCEEYRPVSDENWRCINYCPRCESCLNPAV